MTGRLPRLVALASLAFLLSACVQVRSELTVLEDGTVEGFAEASLNRRDLEAQGVAAGDLLDRYRLTDLVGTPGVGEDDRIEQVYEQGDDVIVALRFAGVEATDLEVLDGSRPFTRTDEGGFAFDLTVDADSYEPGTSLHLEVLFPFEVTSTNGELRGSTVEWEVVQGDGTRRLTAVTSAEAYLSAPAGVGWLAVGLAVALTVTLGGGLLMWRRSRRPAAS